MITLKSLTIENFGIYKGQHTIELEPDSDDKSIILFGGLNGSGKTTFLDALQLVLYGKFARCSNRKEVSYDEFLLGTINKFCEQGQAAKIELHFTVEKGPKLDLYSIARTWSDNGRSAKESVSVQKNGEPDNLLSKEWYSAVDEFFPREVAGLFFFDGEKIEELATPENSKLAIKTGIHALLGLGIVDRLVTDLKAVEIKKRTSLLDQKKTAELNRLESELTPLVDNLEKLNGNLAAKHTQLDSLFREEEAIRELYRNLGGELYDERESQEKAAKESKQSFEDVKKKIRDFAEGDAPLSLVRDLIRRAECQAESEQTTILNRTIVEVLEQRDQSLLKDFNNVVNNKAASNSLEELLVKDRRRRGATAAQKIILDAPVSVFANFDDAHFELVASQANELSETYASRQELLSKAELSLAAIPDEHLVQETAEQLQAQIDKIVLVRGEIAAIEGLIKETEALVETRKSLIARLQLSTAQIEIGNELNGKVLSRSENTQTILKRYQSKLIERHLAKLESLLTTCFNELSRKSDLVQSIRLSPETFAVSIVDQQGAEIQPDKLSAGERQLFAIAILWALGRASDYSLPVVIDTPLGRLDSKHRHKLLQKYFPNASHQVILLSTDEEIDKDYKEELGPAISKEYNIQYEEEKRSSTITAGYF